MKKSVIFLLVALLSSTTFAVTVELVAKINNGASEQKIISLNDNQVSKLQSLGIGIPELRQIVSDALRAEAYRRDRDNKIAEGEAAKQAIVKEATGID